MAKKRKQSIKKKGKLSLSEYFKSLKKGDKVSIIREKGINSSFPERIVGKIGEISGNKGRYCVVDLSDGGKIKKFIIHPINLRIKK